MPKQKKITTLNQLHKVLVKDLGTLVEVKIIPVIDAKIDSLALAVAHGFHHVDERFDKVDARFEKVEGKIDILDKRTKRLEEKTDRLEEKTNRLVEKTNQLEKKTASLEEKTTLLVEKTDQLQGKTDQLGFGQQRIERRLDNKADHWRLDDHEKRLLSLERKAA